MTMGSIIEDTGADRSAKTGSLAQDIQSRLICHVADKTTDEADSAMFNDAAAYTDPHWLAREREALFGSLPLLAALSSDLPAPGDRVLFDEAGPPIVILRDADHKVRAFLNICPHRAARIVTDCKRGMRMSCPFHSWTFDLSGRLIGQPRPAAFEGLDRDQLGLVPVPVTEWGGMIFVLVQPGGDAEIDMPAYLGGFASELAGLGLERATFVKRTRLDARANWKYVLDTFGEGYHVQTLHPETVGRFVLSDTVVYDGAGPHHRMSFANRGMVDHAAVPQDQWPDAELRVIYLLFPNTLIQSTPLDGGRNHIIYRLYPGEKPGESLTYLETYRTAPDGCDVQPWIDAHDFQVSVVGGEDYPMAETAQRGLEAVPGRRLVYGRNELSLQRFHRRVAELIGRPLG